MIPKHIGTINDIPYGSQTNFPNEIVSISKEVYDNKMFHMLIICQSRQQSSTNYHVYEHWSIV